MTITANTQILHDGVNYVTVHLTGLCDGLLGNENNELKVDVSALNPPCVKLSLIKLTHAVNGGSVSLAWQAQDPESFAEFSGLGDFSYANENGIQNDLTNRNGKTGNIVLTTRNFDNGSTYLIKLVLKKKYAATPDAVNPAS